MRCVCPSNNEIEMLLLPVKKKEIDLPILVDELLACLDPYQRRIIESCFMGNKTLREIQEETGTSYTTVQTNREKALKKIRMSFPEVGRHV
jgi:DNA-directed RNA polymerase specialized sigma24 family protein